MLHVGSWPGRCSTARCRGWLYNIKDKSTGNSGEASECISRGQIRLVCIAEVTSDRICLSPFTKDNRGCGFMNATLTPISVRREAVTIDAVKQYCSCIASKRVLGELNQCISALGVVTVTCNPSGDYAKCGVSSRALPLVHLCNQGLSRSRQRLTSGECEESCLSWVS